MRHGEPRRWLRKKIQAKDKYRQKEYKLKKRGWGKRYKSLTGSNKINTSQWGIACIYFVVWVYELYKKDTSQVLACTYFYSEVCVFVKMIQVTKMCESVKVWNKKPLTHHEGAVADIWT